MSFYKGYVARLICSSSIDKSLWEVVEVKLYDTQDDKNIDLVFSHKNVIRVAFVPVPYIENFELDKTKIVKRTFDHAQGIEVWRAQ